MYNDLRLLHYLPSCCLVLLSSVPAEGDVTGSVAALLHQGLVKLTASSRVDGGPAVFAVVLQTGDIGAEKGRKLAAAAGSLALVAELVVQHVWLHFHLQQHGWHQNKMADWALASPLTSQKSRGGKTEVWGLHVAH